MCWEFQIDQFKSILNDTLKMHQIATKFVPQLLSEEQKENHISTSQVLQET
jgi:hypothetical protein